MAATESSLQINKLIDTRIETTEKKPSNERQMNETKKKMDWIRRHIRNNG